MEWSHPVTSCNSSSLCCCSGLVMTSPCVNERSASKSAVCINGRIIKLNEWIIKEIHPTHPPSSSTQHFWWLDSWVLLNIYKPVMLLLWGPGIYISTYIKPLGLWPPPPLPTSTEISYFPFSSSSFWPRFLFCTLLCPSGLSCPTFHTPHPPCERL